eukprot:TRINITY_DN4356_c0_g2_i2.p1 TRINITY_DN4356_c0_g2~~TRINITY_DN4356_c0_g2_i2.p1  ORF type:complete len:268 (-),score=54.29 TRINITY_DN4356_c0_g2_i2:160-963(-)
MEGRSRISKIAVIGGGISGLTLGWLLARKNNYDVTLYEAMATNGLDGYGMDVPANDPTFKNAVPIRLDVPFRYHVPNIYVNLTQMCKVIGVKTNQFSQDIAVFGSRGNFILGYSTLHVGNYSLPIPYLRNFVSYHFWDYMWKLYWFRKKSMADLNSGKLVGKTFLSYLQELNLSVDFIEDFLLNYLSLVHTCEFEMLRNYPAELLVRFLYDVTCGYGLWHFTNGTKDVAERLMEPIHFFANRPVKGLELIENSVKLIFFDGKVLLCA